MTNTQVSTARKFAVAAFSGVVALSLMLPSQLAFAEFWVGDDSYTGETDESGEGTDGGTWSYTAEGQQMTLVDYVGEAIRAVDQDLNVQLEGDSAVEGGISVFGGDLTITGDDSVYGKDKPSVTLKPTEEATYSYAGISASRNGADDSAHSVTIKDANVYGNAENVSISGGAGVTIENSGIYRGDDNKSLSISASNMNNEGNYVDADVVLKGSEIEATRVFSSGTLTIDNTNLTVTPSAYDQESIDKGYYNDENPWLAYAVSAIKDIVLKGEANGEKKEYTGSNGRTWYYLTTGDDYKVELKASATPAYYGATKGMPATGDTTMPLAIGLSVTALCAAGLAFSTRKSPYAGKHVK